MFISPRSRNQSYLCQTLATSTESREATFDEIESLRAEVKRLSDIVNEQSELLSCIQRALSEVVCQPLFTCAPAHPANPMQLNYVLCRVLHVLILQFLYKLPVRSFVVRDCNAVRSVAEVW